MEHTLKETGNLSDFLNYSEFMNFSKEVMPNFCCFDDSVYSHILIQEIVLNYIRNNLGEEHLEFSTLIPLSIIYGWVYYIFLTS